MNDTIDCKEIELLTIASVSANLGIAARTIWRWVAAGTFPQPDLRQGRIVRWKRATVAAWIDEQATKERQDVCSRD